MQNYELESELLTSTKIKDALNRSKTVYNPANKFANKVVEIPAQSKSVAQTDMSPLEFEQQPEPVSATKRRGSLFPGELL